MPNYVRHIMTIHKDAENVLSGIKGEKSAFDFNSLIPMPESLNIASSSTVERLHEFFAQKSPEWWSAFESIPDEAQRMVLAMENIPISADRKEVAQGIQSIYNEKKYGYRDWYSWSRNNWGTKWGACEVIIEGNVVTFDTAWSTPLPIFSKMAEMFPEAEIVIEYADEDIGSNCGTIEIYQGQVIEHDPGNADAFARKIWGREDEEEE